MAEDQRIARDKREIPELLNAEERDIYHRAILFLRE
jgi:hypothetical protein